MKYHHGMTPDPTVLDRLLEISELFQRDLAREFAGTSLTAARTRVLWDLAHSGPSTQQALANRLEVSARNILIMSSILTAFAVVIAVGVVYNNARIALAERTWELASLRVLGFTRAEVSMLLLGELAMGIAIALPLGMLLGWGLTHAIVQAIRSDQFLFPVVIQPRTYAWAAVAVVAAGIASALVVRRRIDNIDMVAALKTRE